MAVSSEVARVVHTANGTATFFSYAPMDGVTSANLKVYLFNPTTGVLTPQTLGTHYTFGSGGVTFNTAPLSGRRVILLRQVDLLQPDIYKTNAPFPAAVTEKRFDEIVKGLQQLNDIAQNRAIILPLGDAGFSTNVLPAVEDRKGRVLYFNATTGDPEAQQLADTIVAAPAWAITFLSQTSAAAGLNSIGGVAKAGDTMTGLLTLSGAPTATLHAATRGYVDTEVGTRVAKAGDTMTGFLTLHADPTAAMHAATKQYVDSITLSNNYVLKAGDTMTGPLTLSGAPTATLHAATKGYVDTEVSTLVAKSGDTMTGFLTLHADPTAVMHAVTKQYADRSGPGGSTGAIATTSGTTYDVTGIPSWANVVEVLFLNVTVNSSSHILLNTRLGTSNGFVTSGYTSATGIRNTEHTSTTQFLTAYVRNDSMNVVVRMVRAHGNTWVQAHVGYIGGGFVVGGGGSVNIGDTLTRIRVFISSNSFTGGHFVVRWTA